MIIAVWDTYVRRENGEIMHFDILVESENQNEAQVFAFGKEFLNSKPFNTKSLTSSECQFCHIEHASEELKLEIYDKGYSIIEMENCN